ncbi:flagellar hook protein FliD [Leptospira wolffii]|uniref:Flagellar hook-associated protein 2 n=1 Tax=Leptospira wolffii TaxID=409998 RepID=A0A2M9ZG95_9LEPT|nr:flagellar filament capping protein FliD [Leptospira wolffii]PJZ67386.1 flagellar hook protein FliD [Leptospira wolffii]TGK62383.1 flagellar hook protein FliD [Leptospira wolffii]TGK70677.1 flagellar hook protein FliD [Leptospira wolffii]TGK74233.1 flagellar hook protein FliD [Leptospira wolffii]TGL32192.1 flagellar hook protein FliD [Leptospira wolffii]
MPAFSIPGLSSGQDTNQIVKKLVELEAKPIRRLEQQNGYNEAQVKAWNDLKTLTTDLQNKTREIISFTAPFATKSIVSDPEGVITGDAARSASSGKRKIEVKELATFHQISGDPIDNERKIPAGNFKILSGDNEKEIEFQGGTVRDLFLTIRTAAAGIVQPTLVKVDQDKSVLTLAASQSGLDNQLKFDDTNGVLKAAALVGGMLPQDPPQSFSLPWEPGQTNAFQPDKYGMSADAKPTFIPGDAAKKEPSKVKLGPKQAFQFHVDAKEGKKGARIEATLSEPLEEGETISLGVVYDQDEQDKVLLDTAYHKEGKIRITFKSAMEGKKIHKVIVVNQTGKEKEFSSFRFVLPSEFNGAKPAKTIAEAKDATFTVDGIEVKRPKNEGLTDVLDGVLLNLNKKSEGPVTVDIKVDSAKGIRMIKEFIEAYNNVLKYSKNATAVNRDGNMTDSKLDDPDISRSFWEGKTKTGVLAGENSVVRLVAGMKTVTTSSFPALGTSEIRTLADIGVSTGDVGSKWADIQDGFLTLDEAKLSRKLAENPDAVRHLFAQDTNSDARMDIGVGVNLVEHLKPYTQFAGGLVTSKIKLLEEQVSDNNKKIKNFESHLMSYEKKLKEKFLYMEQGVGKNKAVGSYLNNNLSRGQGDDK